MAITTGAEHVFTKINRNCAKLIGRSENVVGRRFSEVLPAVGELGSSGLVDKVYRTGKPYFGSEISVRLPCEKGKNRQLYLDFACQPLFDHAGEVQGLMMQGFDVTEKVFNRIDEEAERKETKRKLEEAVRVRDEFISVASHELKTPVTALKLQTDLTTRKIRRGVGGALERDNMLRLLDGTNRQLDQLTRLIDDMLDVARLATGRLKLDLKPANLATISRDAFEAFAPQFLLAHVSASFMAHSEPYVRADIFRVEQVLTNLLSNALKYGNRQPVQVEVGTKNGEAFIYVTDQGIGMEPGVQAAVFERFARAVCDRSVSGLGLGLYIGRQIVQSHGGRIEVVSELGKGSRFSVVLPLLV
jgi:signal transduction histidine kinase